MPTYEYVCRFCHRHHDIFQSMLDAPLKRCPSCKKPGLRRLISGGAGLIFKGTGFYETDYRRPGAKTEPTAEAAAPAATAAKAAPAAGVDKKPAETKTPAKPETPKPKTEPPKGRK
jgi:putative FmdB family regulatory protein